MKYLFGLLLGLFLLAGCSDSYGPTVKNAEQILAEGVVCGHSAGTSCPGFLKECSCSGELYSAFELGTMTIGGRDPSYCYKGECSDCKCFLVECGTEEKTPVNCSDSRFS